MNKHRKEDVIFENFNTEYVKKVFEEKEKEIVGNMTEDQINAYRFGVNTVLDFIEQMCEERFDNGYEDKIVFYHPGELTEYTYEEMFEEDEDE